MNVINENNGYMNIFVTGARMKRRGKMFEGTVLKYKVGPRYAKVCVCDEKTGEKIEPWCYVDRRNGNIHSPKGKNNVDKKIRGNIFDGRYGLQDVNAFGPNIYLNGNGIWKKKASE